MPGRSLPQFIIHHFSFIIGFQLLTKRMLTGW
jgi:hypothetical protein